jgi:hypothetical protein
VRQLATRIRGVDDSRERLRRGVRAVERLAAVLEAERETISERVGCSDTLRRAIRAYERLGSLIAPRLEVLRAERDEESALRHESLPAGVARRANRPPASFLLAGGSIRDVANDSPRTARVRDRARSQPLEKGGGSASARRR